MGRKAALPGSALPAVGLTTTPALHVVWEVGDRVYLVSRNEMRGTVTDTVDGSDGRYCRVHWDGTPKNVGSWHPDGDVECWTLPSGAEVRS